MDYADQKFSSRQIAGIAFVALLHIGIIYALVSGLGEQTIQVLRQPLEAKIIQPAQLPPPEAPPPPPPHLLAPPPVFIPPPIVQIAQPPPPVRVIAAVTRIKPPATAVAPPPPPAPARIVHQTAAGLDPNQSCAPPEYPEDAEDMEQTGVSVLQFLIDPDGDVAGSRIETSSGHASLDNAALRALSQCKFKPAIGADGAAQRSWTSIRYVWQLN